MTYWSFKFCSVWSHRRLKQILHPPLYPRVGWKYQSFPFSGACQQYPPQLITLLIFQRIKTKLKRWLFISKSPNKVRRERGCVRTSFFPLQPPKHLQSILSLVSTSHFAKFLLSLTISRKHHGKLMVTTNGQKLVNVVSTHKSFHPSLEPQWAPGCILWC